LEYFTAFDTPRWLASNSPLLEIDSAKGRVSIAEVGVDLKGFVHLRYRAIVSTREQQSCSQVCVDIERQRIQPLGLVPTQQ
jgi:hypothetical protein